MFYINIFSLVLAAIIIWGEGEGLHFLRIILGLPVVLFFPGYTLIAALFPKKKDLGGIERVALSFGLSIAVVPLIGLALNYTPWGIRQIPILLSLLVFIAAMSAIALYRRRRISIEERFYPAFEFNLPQWKKFSRFDKLLSFLLAAAIVFAVGSIFYVITTPKTGEKFTEFYILGEKGKAEGYPRELSVGEKGRVRVGIVNHEYSPERYYVEIVISGSLKSRTVPVILKHGQKWEKSVDFSASQPHKNLKVEFLLYRQKDQQPYRSLHLWLDVE